MKFSSLISLLLIATSTCSLSAADLVHRVRKDAGMCIVIDDFPSHTEELMNSPLRRRLETLPLFQSWLEGPDVSKVKQAVKELEAILGASLPKSVSELIGKQAVVAVYPQAEGGPAGLLLTTPVNMKNAERLLDLWHVVENAEVTVQPAGHWKRATHRNTVYYVLKEGLFAVSDRESLIRELAAGKEPEVKESLAKNEVWTKPMSEVREESWIRVWFRPELWEGVVKLPNVEGPRGVLLNQLKTSSSVVFELDTEDGVHAGLLLNYKPGKQPDILSNYRRSHPEGPGILSMVSDETVAAMSGRGGLEFVGRFLDRLTITQRDRDQQYLRTMLTGLLIGKDPYTEVLPALGRSWSLEVRRGDSQSPQPVTLLLNSSLEESLKKEVSLQQSLQNLMSSALRFLAVSEGRSGDQIATEKVSEQHSLSYYSSSRGIRPAFVVTQEHLLIASDEDRVRRAILEQDEATSSSGPFSILSGRELANSQTGLFVNFSAVREVVEEQPEKLFKMLRIPEKERSDVKEALQALRLLDGIYATWQCRDGGWSLFVGGVVPSE